MQYSTHDLQIANAWEFLGFKEWHTVPYASSVTFELSYDPLCIEIVLRVTDELEKHADAFHRCFGVRLRANGQAFALEAPVRHAVYVPNKDEVKKGSKEDTMLGPFVKYESFVEIMGKRSYKEAGYSPEVVNENCLKEFVP